MSEREGSAGEHGDDERATEGDQPGSGAPPADEQAPPPPAPPPPPALGAALRRFARSAQEATREVAAAARPHVEQAARRASEEARHAAEVARPRAEELARQARAAAEATRPRAEQAARDTARYAREHEEELRRAGTSGARAAARVVTPRPLRPALDAFEEGLRGERAGGEPQPSSAAPEPGDGADDEPRVDEPAGDPPERG